MNDSIKLLQDESNGLSKFLSRDPNAYRLAREAGERISTSMLALGNEAPAISTKKDSDAS